jgi:hypothetical protein
MFWVDRNTPFDGYNKARMIVNDCKRLVARNNFEKSGHCLGDDQINDRDGESGVPSKSTDKKGKVECVWKVVQPSHRCILRELVKRRWGPRTQATR